MKLNLEKKEEPKTPMTIKLYETIHKRIKIASALSGETMNNIIRHCINESLTKLEKQIKEN